MKQKKKKILECFPLFSLLMFIFCSFQNSVIVWKVDKKITWENFKGIPERRGSSALSDIEIRFDKFCVKNTFYFTAKALFNEDSSYVRKNSKLDVLLRHEQVHFDLVELYARNARKIMSGVKLKSSSVNFKYEWLFAATCREWLETDSIYDLQTEHSGIQIKQEAWEESIERLLNSYKMYSDTTVKMIVIN